MKDIGNELRKTLLWLDSGLQVSIDNYNPISPIPKLSSIMYRRKGLFKKWRVLDLNSTIEDIQLVKEKFDRSAGLSYRVMRGSFNINQVLAIRVQADIIINDMLK